MDNPLLMAWKTPFQVPPFETIKEEHFLPAIKAAMALQIQEIEAIISADAPPSFANTIVALEQSGEDLGRVNRVFSNLSSAETN